MQKIELKHLAHYLPYGLKGNLENLEFYDTVINKELYRVETGKTEVSNVLDIYVIVGSTEGKIEYFKPILRPISDLTKEEYSGIYNLLRVHIGKRKLNTLINEGYGLIDLPYFIFENLSELHFDVFGLIKNGLAIDINTLNK